MKIIFGQKNVFWKSNYKMSKFEKTTNNNTLYDFVWVQCYKTYGTTQLTYYELSFLEEGDEQQDCPTQ